jgi:hypothetical protein
MGYSVTPLIITLGPDGTSLVEQSDLLIQENIGSIARDGVCEVIATVIGNQKGNEVAKYLNSLDKNIKYSVSYQILGTSDDYIYPFKIHQLFIIKIVDW